MIEARLWRPLKNDVVGCRVCNHFCTIAPKKRGLCGVRENRDGILYSLNYGKVAALNLDPVEKKPLYHFQPGTHTFSLGTMGCNLSCSFCQNWSLSQPPREGGEIKGRGFTPELLVDEAVRLKAASISYTYSEPTIFFELMQDAAALAKSHGLKNIMVSNGFMSRECLDELAVDIDAINVDLKCFSEEFYKEISGARLKPVLENLVYIKHTLGWWLEVTTLLIPGKNDSVEELDKLTDFLVNELGTDTPWHISRFHPDYKMNNVAATKKDSLMTAFEMGRSKGLRYVYIGNMPGLDKQDTYCPNCDAMVINRSGFASTKPHILNGRCEYCGEKLHGVDLG